VAEFKPKAYFPFWFRDYVTSNARAKLNWQQRAIYIELLGHCHMDNGIPADKRTLIGKLGLATAEEKADLDLVLQEFFEAHDTKNGWLIHPRTRQVLAEQEQVAARVKTAAHKRWEKKPGKTQDDHGAGADPTAPYPF